MSDDMVRTMTATGSGGGATAGLRSAYTFPKCRLHRTVWKTLTHTALFGALCAQSGFCQTKPLKCSDVVTLPDNLKIYRIRDVWASCKQKDQRKLADQVGQLLSRSTSSDDLLRRVDYHWLDGTPLRDVAERAYGDALLREAENAAERGELPEVLAQIKRLRANEEAFGGAGMPRYRHAYGLLQETLYNQAVRAGDPWQLRELKPWLSGEILAGAYSADLQKMFVLKSRSSPKIDDVRRICPEMDEIGERNQCNRRWLNMSAASELEPYQTGDWRDWRTLLDHMPAFKDTDSEEPSVYLLQRKLEAATVPGVRIPVEELAQVCHQITAKEVASACHNKLRGESLDQADHEWTESSFQWENIQQIRSYCEQDRDCLAHVERLDWKVAARSVVDVLDRESRAGHLLLSKQDWGLVRERFDNDAQLKFRGSGDSFYSLAPGLRKQLVDNAEEAQHRSADIDNRAAWAWGSLKREIEHGLSAESWRGNKKQWVDRMEAILANEDQALRLDRDAKTPPQVRSEIKTMEWRLDQPDPSSGQAKVMEAGAQVPDWVFKGGLTAAASVVAHFISEGFDWILAVIF